ncbi:PREDICTED: adhesion G-protein coupled receptor D1-like [Amphimedon queenslandica]|uniref:Uncharacterized protein n=2 Tax=Amphimedon queenslandica TaxID=400682 RepID=A0AAN0K220_AMPQE|nr:PREDICTED: adhesion G-protein coupled receptor D1-like [Amphimedon queenslandica]|eukprot:XP_019863212.1 PREDICTED: adhesion G-protein coupled receptor D1-like [Amphimedon queenslandica]
MGIGWIGSVLFFSQRLLFIGYIMTIFIAGQGIIIFILYVPLSSNVREAYAKLLKKRLANWSLTRSTVSGDSKKKSTEDNHYTVGSKEVNTIDRSNGLDAEKSKSMA